MSENAIGKIRAAVEDIDIPVSINSGVAGPMVIRMDAALFIAARVSVKA